MSERWWEKGAKAKQARMFSCKDLENFVSKSNTALQLKFGNLCMLLVSAPRITSYTCCSVCILMCMVCVCFEIMVGLCEGVYINYLKFSVLSTCIVCSETDVLDESLIFAPSFTHQVFGEREVIFGYRNLKIKVQYPPPPPTHTPTP